MEKGKSPLKIFISHRDSKKVDAKALSQRLGVLAKVRVKQAEKSSDKKKIGRNDSCPCGSGKKFKKCHGK